MVELRLGWGFDNKMDTFYYIESSIHYASILFCKFLHENKVYRKNGVHHREASGKSFETVISDFLLPSSVPVPVGKFS